MTKEEIINHPKILKFNESSTHKVYRYKDLLFKVYPDRIHYATIKSYSDPDGLIEDPDGKFFREEEITLELATEFFV